MGKLDSYLNETMNHMNILQLIISQRSGCDNGDSSINDISSATNRCILDSELDWNSITSESDANYSDIGEKQMEEQAIQQWWIQKGKCNGMTDNNDVNLESSDSEGNTSCNKDSDCDCSVYTD
jgi:hypothetical protein